MGGSLFMAGGTNQWQWALHGVAARIHRKKSKKKNEEKKRKEEDSSSDSIRCSSVSLVRVGVNGDAECDDWILMNGFTWVCVCVCLLFGVSLWRSSFLGRHGKESDVQRKEAKNKQTNKQTNKQKERQRKKTKRNKRTTSPSSDWSALTRWARDGTP